MFRKPGRKIVMTKGDTVKFDISLEYGSDHIPYDIEDGDLFRFTLKKYLYEKEPIIQKLIPALEPVLEIYPEETEDLAFGEYHYNIEFLPTNEEIYTIIPDSVFVIRPKV